MNSIVVENFEPPDTSKLVAIGNECGLSHWSVTDYLNEFARSDSIILRAVDVKSAIIGFIVGRCVLAADSDTAVDAEIYNIGVRKRFQLKGCGRKLLEEFLARCKQRAVRSVWLEVRASNDRGIGFYHANGFVAAGRRRDFYSQPEEDAIVMSLSLEDFVKNRNKNA